MVRQPLRSENITSGAARALKSLVWPLQVYLILDEFIMGGELQETSKKVSATSRWTSVWTQSVLGASADMMRASI